MVYLSCIRAPLRQYFKNRFFRLYPGLFAVTLGGVFIALYAMGFDNFKNQLHIILMWFVFQVTLGQAYNLPQFYNFGVGVINGSLWTITVEIIFYLMVPVIIFFEKKNQFILVMLIGFSFLIYSEGPSFFNLTIYKNKSIFDVLSLTPIVWGWMFGFGILAAKHYQKIQPFIRYFPLLLIPLTFMALYGQGVMFESSGNRLGLIYFLCYASLILYVAFYLPSISLPFDISYGLYIWHAPVINLLLIMSIPSMWLGVAVSICISFASWFFVEKPVMRFKKYSIRGV